jgi:uncharacterized protein (TIGR02444 family)
MRRSFEEWSTMFYRRERVEPLLIALQDAHGLSVNMLLFCLWAGRHVGEIDPAIIRKAADDSGAFARDTIIPLRGVRRRLKMKAEGEDTPAIEALRMKVKEAELFAERIDQRRLEALALADASKPVAAEGAAGRARRALAAYVRTTAAAETAGFSVSLLEELIELTLGASESESGR